MTCSGYEKAKVQISNNGYIYISSRLFIHKRRSDTESCNVGNAA